MSAVSTALGSRKGAAIPFAYLLLGCTLLVALQDRLFAFGGQIWPTVLWLGLAVVAEWISLTCFPAGLRFGLTAPFVAGQALTSGAAIAVLTECIAFWIGCSWRKGKPAAERIEDLPIPFAASAAGCVTLFALSGAPILLRGAAFVGAWMAVKATSRAVQWLSDGRRTSLPLFRGQLWTVALLMAWIGGAVSIGVVRDGTPQFGAVLLVPMLALALAVRARDALTDQYYGTIGALTQVLQRAHPYTQGHLVRVAEIAEQVALRLGLSHHRARMVREAAVLHDIGKIAVDERILDKTGPLTEQDWQSIKKHPASGAVILSHVEGFTEIANWVLSHHERPDGTGYPSGISDHQIPIESKIIAVADAFDAMTYQGEEESSGRRYRTPLPVQEALIELSRCSGTQFDSRVVRVFLETVESEGQL